MSLPSSWRRCWRGAMCGSRPWRRLPPTSQRSQTPARTRLILSLSRNTIARLGACSAADNPDAGFHLSGHRGAAVRTDALASEKRRSRTGKEEDRGRNLFGPPDPTQRVRDLKGLLISRHALEAKQGRVGRTRCDRVHKYARGKLARPGASEAEHRCLAGGINRSILAPDIGKLGGEIDDARAIRQVRQGFARDQNCAAYVYGEMLVNQIGRGFSE